MATEPEKTDSKKPGPPALRDMLMLTNPVDVRIAPDSNRIAYTLSQTNWKENRFEVVCYVHNLEDGSTYPLNRSGSMQQIEWVDSKNLAGLRTSPDVDEKTQIYLFEGLVGEGWAVTAHKTDVTWFKPFAGGFLFLASNPEREEKKSRTELYGTFEAFEHEDSASTLYYVGLEEAREFTAQRNLLTEDEAKELVAPVIELGCLLEEPLSIQSVVPSPVEDAVFLNLRTRDDLVYYQETSSYCIQLNARTALAEYLRREKEQKEKKQDADESSTQEQKKERKKDYSYLGKIQRLEIPAGASISAVSPDGKKLLVAHRERDPRMFTREDLWIIDLEMALKAQDPDAFLASMVNLTAPLDRDFLSQQWVESGIYISYPDGCQIQMAQIDEKRRITSLDFQDVSLSINFHISSTSRIALVGANATTVNEVYLAQPSAFPTYTLTRLTDLQKIIEGWETGSVEIVRWKSKDGTEIEGVLRKPANFDPTKKYPLALIVHGGPSWLSPAYLLTNEDRRVYPTFQFLQKDILVLKPNYRGSIGRGQAFLELNVNNLGVGDLWDIESGVDFLVEQGWVDAERVGCMGWSQGGYISAFAGLHSNKFKAVSVGAGISDWYTYHISNDIPSFTTDYLSGSPFRNRELYLQTAPIGNLSNAKTPMLIQHGKEDKRVPFSNAMELYRGLSEMKIPVKLFAYPGMGHGINKPRECHAVMYQNLAWFSHYLLGEEEAL